MLAGQARDPRERAATVSEQRPLLQRGRPKSGEYVNYGGAHDPSASARAEETKAGSPDVETPASEVHKSTGAIHTSQREEANDKLTCKFQGYASAAVICAVVLLGDSARGVMFPTLWPLVESLGGDRSTNGFMVGAFSLGRAISSPFIGRASVRMGFQRTLSLCSLIICLGGLLYGTATSISSLLVAQILIGVGSGSLGVTRAYVAELSSPSTRTVLLAYLTAVQYCGFTCTPFIGALLTQIFGDGVLLGRDRAGHEWVVDKFNAPGFLTAIWAMVNAVLLLVVFAEPAHSVLRIEAYRSGNPPPPKAKPVSKGEKQRLRDAEAASMEEADAPNNCCASDEPVLMSLLLLNIATKGAIACFETLGAMFAIAVFNMSIPSAGQTFSTCGTVGVIALLFMGPLVRVFDEVQLIAGGLVLMSVSCFTIAALEPDSLIAFFFVAVALMYSIGYPVGHTAVIGAFSKVAEGKSQGTLLSWFGTAGSLARIFFPMFSGFIAQNLGFSALFSFVGVVLVATLVAVVAGRNCLRWHMNRQF